MIEQEAGEPCPRHLLNERVRYKDLSTSLRHFEDRGTDGIRDEHVLADAHDAAGRKAEIQHRVPRRKPIAVQPPREPDRVLLREAAARGVVEPVAAVVLARGVAAVHGQAAHPDWRVVPAALAVQARVHRLARPVHLDAVLPLCVAGALVRIALVVAVARELEGVVRRQKLRARVGDRRARAADAAVVLALVVRLGKMRTPSRANRCTRAAPPSAARRCRARTRTSIGPRSTGPRPGNVVVPPGGPGLRLVTPEEGTAKAPGRAYENLRLAPSFGWDISIAEGGVF